MAQPIIFEWPATEPLRKGQGRSNGAGEYSEAVHSAYELLQLLHEKGVLNLLRGLVGAGDEIVSTMVKAMDTPESVRVIRNLVLMTQFLASIDPDALSNLIEAMRKAADKERDHRAPGMWELLRRLRSENSRHVAAVGLDLMERVGKGL